MQKLLKNKRLAKWLVTAWGGSLGFIGGAAMLAWLLRGLGRWPASENYLRRFLNHKEELQVQKPKEQATNA